MKRGFKRGLAFSLMLAAVIGISACGQKQPSGNPPAAGSGNSPAASVHLNLGHALSEGTPAADGILAFAAAVEERTEGRVSFDVFPNSQLGSETEMLEQVQIGELKAAAIMIGSMQSLDMRMAIEDLPYMWKDIDHARAAYDGEFGEYLANIMREQKMEKIAYVEWGFRHITNSVKPIKTPADMQGMKIRVAQTKLRVEAFEQIGALPEVLAFSELYGALQQHLIEAQENPLANIVAANFNEVQDYLSLTGHFYNTVMVVVDQDTWNSISAEDQAIILEEAQKMSVSVREENDAKEQDYIDELASRGMQVNDDVDTTAFREAMLPVYDKWESEVFGKEMMDIYRNASGW